MKTDEIKELLKACGEHIDEGLEISQAWVVFKPADAGLAMTFIVEYRSSFNVV